MSLARLTLTDFRSHADLTLTPGPGFVVLTGENGAGKTNVLEAVSMLAPGRGLRGAALTEMARRGGSGGFAINATLGDEIAVGTGTLAHAPERRVVRINGATRSATALAEWLSIVWLTPAQDRLFTDSAGERRRFLDRLVLALDPGHASHSARYEAAMRQRNRLLADGPHDGDWLTALETAMMEHGGHIADARQTLAEALSERIANAPAGPFARATLSLEGFDAARPLAPLLAAARERDAAAGRTLAGPHRQDLIVMHADKHVPAALASTGEQKALLIGLVLAHADLVAERQRRRPLLLLDEVAAHLDERRRAALFDRLAGDGQVWLTGTDQATFTAIGKAMRVTL